MYWVMVAVIAVVVFGVAAVASGQGGGIAPAHPDRPDTGLPPGPLEPGALGRVRFGLALRGYRMDEVDEALDRLGVELAAREARIAELEWQLGAVEGRPREPGEG